MATGMSIPGPLEWTVVGLTLVVHLTLVVGLTLEMACMSGPPWVEGCGGLDLSGTLLSSTQVLGFGLGWWVHMGKETPSWFSAPLTGRLGACGKVNPGLVGSVLSSRGASLGVSLQSTAWSPMNHPGGNPLFPGGPLRPRPPQQTSLCPRTPA